MNRITKTIILTLGALILTGWCAPAAESQKPNVLLFGVDDLNDWVGFLGGHPDAKTPHLDRLAGLGTAFVNAHCTVPVCNPSRVALLSGIAPERSGVYGNSDKWVDADALQGTVPLPLHFQRHGYRTLMAGKIFHHLPTDTGVDQNVGKMGGQAVGVKPSGWEDPFEDLKCVHKHARFWGPLEGADAKRLSDPKLADWAAKQLAVEKPDDSPFLLMVGFHRPHLPFTAPKEFFDLFDPEKITLPPLDREGFSSMPWMGQQAAAAGFQEIETGTWSAITERGQYRAILHAYLASCAFVDAQIGKVLDALERSAVRDNTIVVLFSDHGYGLGERYHFHKWGLWDDTTRVPVVIHAPEISKPDARVEAAVSLLDLYPTLVDLCGLPQPPQQLDGESLRPLIENPAAVRERPALTTLGRNNNALVDDRWRYIRWADGSEELYDRRSDPDETRNLADNPEHIDVKARFAKWLPESSVPAVFTDNGTPLTLTRETFVRHFFPVQDTFASRPITVRAKIGPKITDGVILTHGNQFCGYALYAKDGRLNFAVMDVPRPFSPENLTPERTIITARESLKSGAKLEVEARIEADGTLRLFVDDREIASGQAETLSIHPSGPMILGQCYAVYPEVGDYRGPSPFKGDIESVTVTTGPKNTP